MGGGFRRIFVHGYGDMSTEEYDPPMTAEEDGELGYTFATDEQRLAFDRGRIAMLRRHVLALGRLAYADGNDGRCQLFDVCFFLAAAGAILGIELDEYWAGTS